MACPQCGAALKSVPVSGPTVECPYCHSEVIVPLDLRPPKPPPTPVVHDYETSVLEKPGFSFGGALAASCVGVVVLLIFLAFFVKPGRKASGPSSPSRSLPTVPDKASPTAPALTFGGEGTGPGLFQDAQDVAVDGNGNIYVSDETNRIQKFDSKGQFVSLWTVPQNTKFVPKTKGGPDRLLADRDGRVYVVVGGVTLKFDGASGESLVAAQGTDFVHDAALKADGGMAIISSKGNDDELVVLDGKGKAVKRVQRFISTQLDKQVPVYALKVAVDGVGNIFAIYALGSVYGEHWYDEDDLAVFRFTPDGKYVSRFGGGGQAAGQFRMPNAIAVDGQSRVYVGDGSGGIHIFTAEGRYIETLKTPFWVQGMAFDSANDLYVVGSNQVSKLVLPK